MEQLWILLIINVCVSIFLFFYIGFYKKDLKKAFLMAMFVFLMPIVGLIFLFAAEVVYYVLFLGRDKNLNADDLSFSQKRTRMIISNDIEKEADIVPIEEALRVSDTMAKRQMFLDVLKRPDVDDYLAGIQDAVKQEDTEVVHYAASYISDTIAKYKESERKLRTLCVRDKSREVLLSYINFTVDMLGKHIFSKPEQTMYVSFFENHMELLYKLYPNDVDGNLVSRVITYHKETMADNNIIYKWICRAESLMEQDVVAAKEVLKYYFENKNKKKFKEATENIKNSPLILDAELVEWVRFFG